RVRWNLQANQPARGAAGTGRAEQPAVTAPAMQPPAPNPPATPPAAGQQGAGREDRPAGGAQGARGAPAARGAEAPPAAQPAGGGRGRGGFAPTLPAGTYLVKVTVDGKVIGTKTVVVEADSLQ